MREPESGSAARAALDWLRQLEARVDAPAEAAGVLARAWGQPDGRAGKPPRPGEAARRAHELLRLAKPEERDRLAGGGHMAPCRA